MIEKRRGDWAHEYVLIEGKDEVIVVKNGEREWMGEGRTGGGDWQKQPVLVLLVCTRPVRFSATAATSLSALRLARTNNRTRLLLQ